MRLQNPRLEARWRAAPEWCEQQPAVAGNALPRVSLAPPHRSAVPPASRRGLVALSLLALAACQQKADAPAKTETAAAAPAQPEAPKVQIAQKYQGEWSLDLASCGDQTDQRLIVAADRINFYGADAPLTKLEEQPDGTVEALAHVSDNTGGYDVINRYRLSEDGQTMTLTGAPGQPPVRLKRCPEQTT